MNPEYEQMIRDHRTAFLEACASTEEKSIEDLAIALRISVTQIRRVWFEDRGEKN